MTAVLASHLQPHPARTPEQVLLDMANAKLRAAMQWRLDNRSAQERDALWRAYRTGALWGIKSRGQVKALRGALDEAERVVTW